MEAVAAAAVAVAAAREDHTSAHARLPADPVAAAGRPAASLCAHHTAASLQLGALVSVAN